MPVFALNVTLPPEQNEVVPDAVTVAVKDVPDVMVVAAETVQQPLLLTTTV